MQSVLEVLKKTEAFFTKAGLETPKIDAEWLLAETLHCKRLDLFLRWEDPIVEDILDKLRERVKRRASGEPLQYVLGHLDFHDIRLNVEPGALIPRSETEELVEKVLERLASLESPKVVDLGTGSGAIALALAKALPAAKVLAVDRSAVALAQAKANADRLGLRGSVAFRSGDWLKNLQVEADCIVSNPPYLTEKEWEEARSEVRQFEPKEALVASDEGMADLKIILRAAIDRLSSGGLLALEMGIAHGAALSEFAASCGYVDISVEQDATGRDRFLFTRKP